MKKEKSESKAAGGRLSELPRVTRARMRWKALWELCPPMAQGALAWAALAPWTAPALAMLTRFDLGGDYELRWGQLGPAVLMALLSLLVSCAFMPLIRGFWAIRGGSCSWADYSKALRGVDPSTGERRPAGDGAWALFGWMWLLAIGASWLQDRSLRAAGATLGRSVSGHLWSAARLELAVLILLSLGTAGLALSAGGAGPSWRALPKAAATGAAHARRWARDAAGGAAREWRAARAGGAGRFAAWAASIERAPFAARVLCFSFSATAVWWWATAGLSAAFDPWWLASAVGERSWSLFFGVAALCALAVSLSSREHGRPEGSALWFTSHGPGVRPWAIFCGVGVALDAALSWDLARQPDCTNPGLIGAGLLVSVFCWTALVFVGEAMAWLGGVFEAWSKGARTLGPPGVETYAVVAWDKARKWWSAASVAKAKLEAAVDRRAMENEHAIALAQHKELAEEIPEPAKRSTRSNRL